MERLDEISGSLSAMVVISVSAALGQNESGIPGDAGKATYWHERADEMGAPDAKARIIEIERKWRNFSLPVFSNSTGRASN